MSKGRPTKYKPVYCKRAKDHLSKGYSIKSLAGIFNVAPSTIHEWQHSFPDFSSSIEVGRSLGEQFYIKKAIRLIEGERGSAEMVKFLMKNLYKNYKDNPSGDSEKQQITINLNRLDE